MILRQLPKILIFCTISLISACAFSPTEGIHRTFAVKAGGEEIIVAAPHGFCIDERTTEESRVGAFVFITDCAHSVDTSPTIARVPISAVLTASISNSGLPGRDAGQSIALSNLKEFLETPIGQLSLGKSGNGSTIQVLSLTQTENAVFAFVEDSSVTSTTGESPRFWRAFTEVGGRLAALSATGYNPADPDQKRTEQILIAFVAALHAAND